MEFTWWQDILYFVILIILIGLAAWLPGYPRQLRWRDHMTKEYGVTPRKEWWYFYFNSKTRNL